MKFSLKYLFLCLPFIVASCGDDVEEVGNKVSSDNQNANVVTTDNSVSRLELPRLNPDKYDYICHKLSNGDVNYSMEYDKSKYHAAWVAYTYDKKSAQRNYTSRTDAWASDPYISAEYAVAGGQTFPGYNRGHIVGSAERYYSQEANAQTFYMSNMSPMNGQFNSEYWGEIEDKVRDNWGRTVLTSSSQFYGGTLYVCKGGTLDQTIGTISVRNGKGQYVQMAIPKYYWIALLYVNANGGAKSIAFWMEHKDYNNTSADFLKKLRTESVRSVNELEQLTGLDFFCNLNDNIEEVIESERDPKQWPGIE